MPVRDHCLAPERVDAPIYGGRYRPLFEDLPPLRVDESALHALGRPGGPCDLGVDFAGDADSNVASVWPFFGRIVGEVFVGIIDGDPESFRSVDPGWSPTLPKRDGAFGLADILAPA